MAIDIRNEELIRLSDVPSLKNLPRREDGRRLHISTIYRWTTAGVRGVRLETVQVGGTRCTSEDALQRFFNELTKPQVREIVSMPSIKGHASWISRLPRWRQKQIQQAERELKEAGFDVGG